MPTFEYVAVTADGKRVVGTAEADHQTALVRRLRQAGMVVISANEKRASVPVRRSTKVNRKQLARFYSQLSDLLRNGVPIIRALETLEKQYGQGTLSSVLHDIREQVAQGAGLAEAMAQHPHVFSELAVSMVRAGQEAGFLEDVLKRIAQFTQWQEDLRGKILGALAYPIFLVSVGAVVLTGLMVFFVPRFEPIFARLAKRGELPGITVFVIETSHFLGNYGFLILLAVGAAIFLFRQWIRTEQGRLWFDSARLKLPLVGHVQRNLAIVRFCRILGTMLANGIPILKALRIAKDSTGNEVLSRAIARAADNVSSGNTLTEPLRASGMFPPDVIEMIAVAEESNTLEGVLLEIADSTEAATTRQLELAVRMLEPLMLLVMALVTLVVAAGILLPIFRMSSVVS